MLVRLLYALTPVAYFYFNWRYFALAAASLRLPRMAKLPVFGSFLLNFGLFFICSVLELNLICNWAVFFFLLFAETMLYGKCRGRNALLLSLIGTLYGLAMNIFCRCAVAIAIQQPLRAFDNHVSSAGNYKVLPVLLGFLLGGAALHLFAKPAQTRRLQVLFRHPKHLPFQLELMGVMFLYLFLNLLLYQSRGNGMLLKLWGIKSCVFALMGTYLGMRYSLQMCGLSDYREQNRAIQRELVQKEREERALRAIAYRDVLTGAYNRPYALETMARLLEQQSPFTLCFMDLDHLKEVNDRHGHAAGDRYLVTAARELMRVCRKERDLLFRYGGDEFLILFADASVSVAEERLQLVNGRLAEMCRRGEVPFSMSVSYGAVDSAAAADAGALIHAADQKMYTRKRNKPAPSGPV